jgi:hypothetical protein
MKKLGLVLILLFVATSAFAQFKGSAKFVCGKPARDVIDAFAFPTGTYFTTINVTNPNPGAVSGTKRFSIALLAQRPGRFTPTIHWTLRSSESMQIDCGDIYRKMQIPPGTFIDGFVHIVGAPSRFDVTAVYSTANTDGRIVSMDIEEVTMR